MKCLRYCALLLVPALLLPASAQTATHTYVDKASGVSFQYPASWKIVNGQRGYSLPTLSGADDVQTKVMTAYTPPSRPRTNLDVLYVTYAIHPAVDAAACRAFADTFGIAPTKDQRINGVSFSTRDAGEGSAGHSMNGILYATFRHRTCYLFDTEADIVSDGLMDNVPNTTKAQLHAWFKQLDAVMQTVKFVN